MLVIGIAIRVVLLPTQGFRVDMDQFAAWVHHIALNGLGHLYDDIPAGRVSFGPVIGLIWGVLAAIVPGFATATDAADTTLRAVLKVPASIADIGIALVAVFALRERPRWAVLAGAAILLHPAIIDVSAWWGQYESIYVLSALAATVAATRGRNGVAAALMAVSLLTKPQAIPFLVPFAAWFWATGYKRRGVRGGLRELARTGAIGMAVLVVGFLPFLAQNGPANYLANVRYYQDEVFNVLSLRAWNPWWLLQVIAANGDFIVDDVPIIGPISFRTIGLFATGVFELVLFAAVLRDPKPRTFVLALAASTIVFFTFMTQMHERYAYATAIFLTLLLSDRAPRWVWLVFSVVFTANLLVAIWPFSAVGVPAPASPVFDVLGPIAALVVTLFAVLLAGRPRWTAAADLL